MVNSLDRAKGAANRCMTAAHADNSAVDFTVDVQIATSALALIVRDLTADEYDVFQVWWKDSKRAWIEAAKE